MFIGTVGVFWYKNYDERIYCMPVMSGKIQKLRKKVNDEFHCVFFTASLLP